VPAPWTRCRACPSRSTDTSLGIVGTVGQLAIDGRHEVLRAEQIANWKAALVK
jgi:hypothetical protein